MSSFTPPAAADRRQLARQARDAFPAMGVYAIRDQATGSVRVASSRNVHGTINRILFELRLGSHPDKALQAEWRRGGPERFSFEVLELVKERSDPAFDYAAELRALEELHRAMLADEPAAGPGA
jgi:hypothetical protein